MLQCTAIVAFIITSFRSISCSPKGETYSRRFVRPSDILSGK